MKTLRFFRQDNKWYADVPNHTLEENEMVFGSDVMLEILASGRESVTLKLSDNFEDDYEKPIMALHCKEHDNDGAFYSVEVLTTLFTGSRGREFKSLYPNSIGRQYNGIMQISKI